MRRASVPPATSPPTREGRGANSPDVPRPKEASIPTAVKMPMPISPKRIPRRTASMPSAAAPTASSRATVPSRTALSFVPKVSIAQVLSHLGTLSTTRLPTLTTGDSSEVQMLASNSPMARPAAAEASPAMAPIHQGERVGESSRWRLRVSVCELTREALHRQRTS